MVLRVATFNLENLFGRYPFLDKPPEQQPKDYAERIKMNDVVAFQPGRGTGIKPQPIAEEQRKNTALAALAVNADVMAVCEVENLTALRLFNAKYMKNAYDRCVLVDGNDPRAIDVGLLIRKGLQAQIVAIRSNADLARNGTSIIPTTNLLDMKGRLGQAAFSRDCLEVDIDINGTPYTFLVNHFKAQEIRGKRGQEQDSTSEKRRNQALIVAGIAASIKSKRKRYPIVLGDLNKDIAGEMYDGSLDPLLDGSTLFNASEKIEDPSNRWTHYYSSKKSISQLDYILVDKRLKSRLSKVDVFRGGLSSDCKQYSGKRVGTISKPKGDDPHVEASDHCALFVDIEPPK